MDKNLLILLIITLFSKIVAFIKELLFANYYGASEISDAYFMSLTLPLTVLSFISTGITTGFVPTFSKIKINAGLEAGRSFTNKVLFLFMCFCSMLIIIYYVFQSNIINLLAVGFSEQLKELTRKYSNISILAIYFSSITCILNSYLVSINRTAYSGFLSIPLNSIVILFIIISYYLNIYILLPIGYFIGCIMQSILFMFFAYQNSYKLYLDSKIFDQEISSFIKSIGILAIGSSVNQINVLIDKMLASNLSVGSVASLEYGNRILDLISGVFILSISTVQYPKMTLCFSDKSRFTQCLSETCMLLLIILFPITLTVMAFPSSIVKLIYGRGAFDAYAQLLTTKVLFFYGIGLLAIGLREILVKAYCASYDLKTPTINGILGVCINIVFNFIFIDFWGIGGLALATSLSAIVVTVTLYIKLCIKQRQIIMWQKKIDIMYLIIINIALLIISKIVFYGIAHINTLEIINFFIAIFIYYCMYIYVCVKLNFIDISNIKIWLCKKINQFNIN